MALSLALSTPALAATPPPAPEDETLLSDFDVRTVAQRVRGPRAPPLAFARVSTLLTLSPVCLSSQVRFLGQKVDHRVIVEWVVAGQTIGFIGSAVAGLSAAERKREVELLNTRLLTVNKQLREKARSSQAALQHASAPEEVAGADGVDNAATEKVLTTLRAAKSALKLRDGSGAKQQFEEALGLVNKHEASLEAAWKARRKALRGLGAACQVLGEHDAALRHLQQVLTLSEEHGDVSGAADAIGVIADVYTDKGDLDNAGKWYDRYIEAMNA